MANLDYPNGFTIIKGWQVCNEYDLAAANSQIGEGDLIERHTDGYVRPAVATSTTIVGVAAESKAANSGGKLKVYDDPNAVFVAQADDANIAAQTDLRLNYDIVASAPNSISGRSTMEIDASTKAATATLPIKVLRLASVITKEGNALGANVKVECLINNHLLKSTGVVG